MYVKKIMAGCFFLCLGAVARSEAQTATLQAVADSTLKPSPANKNRGDSTLELAGDGRVLVRFDQAAISAAVGSGRLVSASLELFVHSTAGSWGPDGRPLEAHLLTTGWSEMGVTWNCADDSNPANNKPDCATPWNGGVFADEATDSVAQTSAEHVWVPFDVTADVAAFLGGTPNHGWIVVKADGDQSGKVDYGSREGAEAERPRLVLLVESAANDQVSPGLAITSPSQPILVNEPAPTVVVAYSDGGSGVDLTTLQVQVDGQDATASCVTGPQSATCQASTLAAGNHTIQALLRDHAGNTAQTSATFQLLLGPGPHVVTLQAVGDTAVRKGASDKNFGTEPILRVRESGPNRALAQFDAPSLASTLNGATVVSASLELNVEKNGRNWGKTGRTVDAHRLTAAWTETGATWDCANDSNTTNGNPDCAAQWAGGSFAATPTASVLHTRDLTGWVRYDVTADVAAFAAGTASFGWLLKKTDETKSGLVEYDSREGTPGAGPRLVVVFTTPVTADTTPPVVAITSPAGNSLVSSPTVTVTGTVSDNVRISSLTVNGLAVPVANGVFQTTVNLAEGSNTIFAIASDASGNQSTVSVAVTLDPTPPTLIVDSPTPGQSTNQALIRVAGSATDLDGVGGITVNGTPVALSGERFDTTVALVEGSNTVTIAAVDSVGNQTQTTVAVTRFSLPTVTITSPADLSYLAATTVDVHGTVSDPVIAVVVNGVNAQVSGTSFVARDVSLLEGGNILTGAATDSNGHIGTASINLVRDLTPPRVTIDDPVDGARLLDSTVTVSGLVNDIVDGTVNASEATVTVNGWPATVANRSYTVDVPLTPGDNLLTAIAVDRSGNAGQASVTLHLDPAEVPRLAAVFGDHQQAVIGTQASTPLTAVLLDAAGHPVAGKPAIFKVRGNDGSLDGGKREIAVLSGSDGRASAHFTLGTRVGAGNQVVEASSVGFLGPAVFRATALPGSPVLLVADSGNQQVGKSGSWLRLRLAGDSQDALAESC
ncbi:MAG: DNRLRE domain-containing protein [Thermoanaerobaculia bacterium]